MARGWPSDDWIIASMECLKWAWRTDDERQEVVLALYCAWPGWQPEKGSWICWAKRYVQWWLKGLQKKERRAVKQTTMARPEEVSSRLMVPASDCGCGGKLFSQGLCQRCYRRKRRRSGKSG